MKISMHRFTKVLKIGVFCACFLSSFTAFSEEPVQSNLPEFMQNWIIPETCIFGVTKHEEVSSLRGVTMHGVNLLFSGITINDFNQVTLPPWFIQQGFSVYDSYKQWKEKLLSCPEFVIQESNPPKNYTTYKNGKKVPNYYAELNVEWKQDDRFFVCVTFTNENRPVSMSLRWEQKSNSPDYYNSADLMKRHSDEWNYLTPDQKYFNAFSSNLMQLNSQNLSTFNPAYKLSIYKIVPRKSKSKDTQSINILKNSWSITNKEELFAQIESLESGGHAGSYREILAIDNANPLLSVLEISNKECLSVLETTRLFFVRKMKDVLGDHGIEAWDKGREISLFRWALAAGYVTEEEIIEPMLKISNVLKADYTSWEDFTAHYIAGRAFYGLYDGDYGKLTDNALNAAAKVIETIPVLSLPFDGSNAKGRALSLTDAWYEAEADAKEFDKALSLSYIERKDVKEQHRIAADSLVKKYPNNLGLLYVNLQIKTLLASSYKTLLPSYREADKLFSVCQTKSSTYNNFYYRFGFVANKLKESDLALYAFNSMSNEAQHDADVYYEKGYAYANLIGTSPDYETNAQFSNSAWENFELANSLGYELPENLIKWLKSISAQQ